jgi:hypothetical protein
MSGASAAVSSVRAASETAGAALRGGCAHWLRQLELKKRAETEAGIPDPE